MRWCEVFTSPYILEEVDRVLARKIGATQQERLRVHRWIQGVCQVVDPVIVIRKEISCPDPKDLPILQLTLSVHADFLITGDHDLLKLKELQGIRIIPPAIFWHSL